MSTVEVRKQGYGLLPKTNTTPRLDVVERGMRLDSSSHGSPRLEEEVEEPLGRRVVEERKGSIGN